MKEGVWEETPGCFEVREFASAGPKLCRGVGNSREGSQGSGTTVDSHCGEGEKKLKQRMY